MSKTLSVVVRCICSGGSYASHYYKDVCVSDINPQRLWQAALGELELKMARATFDTWLRDTHCIGVENGCTLVIGVKNGFAVEWLDNRLYPVVKRTLARLTGDEMEARFVVWDAKQTDNGTPVIFQEESATPQNLPRDPGLNGDYSFESFVVGPSNRLAQAASLAVAESPARAYNPLFIHGGVGLGKTHLLHAIGHHCYLKGMQVLYITSETFTNGLIESIRMHTTEQFREKYRTADVLLVDDIQFIAGKESTQEEFFHTFNALLEGGQQVIVTCDRFPKEISDMEERLKSRFGWGLTVMVEPPELETRVAILMKKAEQANVKLSSEAAFFIAQKIRSNVRELEGALRLVIANAHFTGSEITPPFIRESLKDLLALHEKQVSIDNIQRTVAEYYKIKVADLLSKRRTRTVTRPRQVAMSLAKELTNHSLPEIGDAFGGRDHTTVLHACKKIVELQETDPGIREDYQNFMRLLTT